MYKSKEFTRVLTIISILFHLLVGIIVFIIAFQQFEVTPLILGLLIAVGSLPHIMLFARDVRKHSFLVIGLVALIFAIIAMASDLFSVNQVCVIWGAIDIARGVTEIIDSAPKIRKEKLELIEIAVSLGDIVIGILLCLHMEEGLQLHLIYFGIAFVIISIRYLVGLFLDHD